MNNKLLKFIRECNVIHKSKYDYKQVKLPENGFNVVISILCPVHGIFHQSAYSHIKGHGCISCGFINTGLKVSKSLEKFIHKANNVHNGFYDYSCSVYNGANSKIEILCPVHGTFEQTVKHHLSGHGCKKCSFGKLAKKKAKSELEFIAECSNIHKEKYDYSKVSYVNNQSKITIICKEHGEFEQYANNHLFKRSECPECSSSIGEKTISIWLTDHQYKFETQKKFKKCKHKRQLPFDFYLSDHNILIEYDGIQHFESIQFFGGDDVLEQTRKRDAIKNNFCLENKIKLIRIAYHEDIEEVLKLHLN
jgi:very-short-patch-repair endonuclease